MPLRFILTTAALMLAALSTTTADDWASTVKFPSSEKPVPLWNGKNFDGWEGNTGENGTPKYFSIKDGAIVARWRADRRSFGGRGAGVCAAR